MLRTIKYWKSPRSSTSQSSHLTLIAKTIQVIRTRHVGHCWRSRDELISDILLWTPSHRRIKAGLPARTDIQQLCTDTGCSFEDLPGAMDDREEAGEGQWDPYWRCDMMMMVNVHLWDFQVTHEMKQCTTY